MTCLRLVARVAGKCLILCSDNPEGRRQNGCWRVTGGLCHALQWLSLCSPDSTPWPVSPTWPSSSQIDFLLILYMSSSYLVLRSFLQAFPSSPNALPLASAGLAMSRHYDSAPVTPAALSQTSHILITHIIPWELSTFFQAPTTP